MLRSQRRELQHFKCFLVQTSDLFLVSVVYSGSSVSAVATGFLVENAPRSKGQWVSQRDGDRLEAKAERAAGKS